jgi:hypothetical protein
VFILETNEAAEKLKTFVLTHGLPTTDMALFGIKCPYCGKSDRINLWDQLARSNGSLGVCKFCQNLLLLQDQASAVPLYK